MALRTCEHENPDSVVVYDSNYRNALRDDCPLCKLKKDYSDLEDEKSDL